MTRDCVTIPAGRRRLQQNDGVCACNLSGKTAESGDIALKIDGLHRSGMVWLVASPNVREDMFGRRLGWRAFGERERERGHGQREADTKKRWGRREGRSGPLLMCEGSFCFVSFDTILVGGDGAV